MAYVDPVLNEEALLGELEPQARGLFIKVRPLEYGCSILRFLNQRRNILMTVEGIAYHMAAKRSPVERDLQALVKFGLVSRVSVVGIVFFGLTEDREMRRAVRDVCRWQDGWQKRLSGIQGIVSGRAPHPRAH